MTIRYTQLAQKRLNEIFDFVAENNPRAATILYNKILSEVEILQHFPQLAAVEPLLSKYSETFRSLVVRQHYKVIYFIEDKTIVIATVWDCRQDTIKHKKLI
ncbi:hypothetical protein FACS1894195_2900 [Bacteroidia bacterium]|nr:hypothetical protein FACS1894195_2900 [Bacteroidia bacterium]